VDYSTFQWGNTTTDYIIRFVQLVLGASLLAYGIAIEVRCNVLLLAGEGLPSSISKAFKWDFGKVKICTDTLLVAIAVVFSFSFFGSWRWDMIGFGTLFSMIAVGAMVRFFAPKIVWVDKIFMTKKEEEEIVEEVKETHYPLTITISRYYGSGGHEIGEKLAEKLGIHFYDMNIVNQTADELGYSFDFVKENEQNISNSKLLELILTDSSIPRSMQSSEGDEIFVAQSRIIRSLAKKGDCVIIGRCADYLLKDNPKIFRVFVKSDKNFATKRIMSSDNLSMEEAQKKIQRVNKGRSNQYWQYTNTKWDDMSHYDLIINTSKTGIETAVDLIFAAIKNIQEKQN
jgi:cytidylate kinase